MKVRLTAAVAVLSAGALIALSTVGVASGSGATTQNVVMVYNGPAIPNTHAAPSTAAYSTWCASTCSPSVMMPAVDASTGRVLGQMYVWTKNLDLSGGPIAFGEFIWFALDNGDVFVNSGEHGTVGAAIPGKSPTHINGDPGIVVAGGGDGAIVGGTGKYSKWTGKYTDRVFVELDFLPTGANYYDQLFWSINPD